MSSTKLNEHPEYKAFHHFHGFPIIIVSRLWEKQTYISAAEVNNFADNFQKLVQICPVKTKKKRIYQII